MCDDVSGWGTVTFAEPATGEAIQEMQTRLGDVLPLELRDLLMESDGLIDVDGVDCLWPVERIGVDNELFRTEPSFAQLYLPFEGLVFFADAGDGDQFAVCLRGAGGVFAWNHENDSRLWVAQGVMEFLHRWLTRTLPS